MSEKYLRRVLETVPDAMILVRRDGTIAFANEQAERIFGYRRKELLGLMLETLIPQRFRRPHFQHRKAYFADPHVRPMGTGLELSGLRKNGSEFPVEISLSLFESEEGLLASSAIRDITDRKRAEQALRESEARFRIAASCATDLIYEWHLERGTCDWFGDIDSNLGYAPGEFPRTAEALLASLHPDDYDRVMSAAKRQIEEGEPFDENYRVKTAESTYRHWRDRGTAIRDETGKAYKWIGACTDITERKRTQEALRESEGRLRLLLETTLGIPWEADAKTWHFTYVGPQAVKIVGYPLAEWYQKDFWPSHIHPEDRDWAIDFCEKSSERSNHYEFEYRMISPDGNSVWLHDLVTVERVDGEPRTLRGLMIDITERKRAEEALKDLGRRLIQAQEEERRHIARELHDDLNQRLAALAIEIGVLRQPLSEAGESVGDRLARIQQGIMDLSEGVRHISHELHPATLEHLGLAAALQAQCRDFSEHVDIPVEFSVRVDPKYISPDVALCLYRVTQEALSNVVKHSAAKDCRVTLTGTESNIELAIADSGGGFASEQASGYPGLGLVSMEERVRLLGGTFSVQSEPGEGTKLTVSLPLRKGESSPQSPSGEIP